MHVQVRLGRAARIANMPQDIADFDYVPNFHSHGTGPHVRVQNVTMGPDLDDDVIASGGTTTATSVCALLRISSVLALTLTEA